jgi:hypothetical protein
MNRFLKHAHVYITEFVDKKITLEELHIKYCNVIKWLATGNRQLHNVYMSMVTTTILFSVHSQLVSGIFLQLNVLEFNACTSFLSHGFSYLIVHHSLIVRAALQVGALLLIFWCVSNSTMWWYYAGIGFGVRDCLESRDILVPKWSLWSTLFVFPW